ncbi:hypothetical protein BRARA_C03485 [Brassica rapa]|uniref:Dirigent protein n=1 Tax=Brassica campestris TaxID=3711 RepID=A0A398A176_BRACM|nr:hypothetical protein BRARA_C03485 [Brassica rapa]
MTKLIIILAAQIILLAAVASAGHVGDFARTTYQKHPIINKKEKLTHLHFYWHDSTKGRNPSSVMIQQPSISCLSTDDPLTTDVPRNSTVVGHAQGIYAGASRGEIGYLMVLSFAFKTGKYNGSTISVLGRNIVFSKVREMPVVGGSGMFRFASGYVEARTKSFEYKTGEATVEYNCYVVHY